MDIAALCCLETGMNKRSAILERMNGAVHVKSIQSQ